MTEKMGWHSKQVIQNNNNSDDDADSEPEIIQDDNDKENAPMPLEPRAEDETFDGKIK